MIAFISMNDFKLKISISKATENGKQKGGAVVQWLALTEGCGFDSKPGISVWNLHVFPVPAWVLQLPPTVPQASLPLWVAVFSIVL